MLGVAICMSVISQRSLHNNYIFVHLNCAHVSFTEWRITYNLKRNFTKTVHMPGV